MCHKLPKFIENEPENHADILDYLKTGSGKIIYSSPHSLIVRHESGTHYVSTDGLDRKELYNAIPRHGVFVIDDSDRSFYKENGYLLDKEECYLFSYLKEEVTSSEDGISLLSQEYKKIVSLNYRGTESDEYTDRAIDEQRIYGLFSDSGELMAFGGFHIEGAMGMLHVIPPFRHNGYGMRMEKFLISKALSSGHVPFCNVYRPNKASMALQEKLGLVKSTKTFIWAWRE